VIYTFHLVFTVKKSRRWSGWTCSSDGERNFCSVMVSKSFFKAAILKAYK